MIKDPWARDYRYRNPEGHAQVDVFTLGADNAVGGSGENQDIGSW